MPPRSKPELAATNNKNLNFYSSSESSCCIINKLYAMKKVREEISRLPEGYWHITITSSHDYMASNVKIQPQNFGLLEASFGVQHVLFRKRWFPWWYQPWYRLFQRTQGVPMISVLFQLELLAMPLLLRIPMSPEHCIFHTLQVNIIIIFFSFFFNNK